MKVIIIIIMSMMILNTNIYSEESKFNIIEINSNSYVVDSDIQGYYNGESLNEKATGNGYAKGKDEYRGNFIDGKKEGFGIYTWSTGSTYEGNWKNDNKNGYGVYKNKEGFIYEGEYLEGKKEGKGKLLFPKGDYYIGDFKNDRITGKGKSVTIKGSIYEGDFVDGKWNGQGKLINPFYTSEGEFRNGKLNGKGKVTMKNGDFYEGEIVDDQANGQGILTFKKKGVFLKGIFNGKKIIGTAKIEIPSKNIVYDINFNTDDMTCYYKEKYKIIIDKKTSSYIIIDLNNFEIIVDREIVKEIENNIIGMKDILSDYN